MLKKGKNDETMCVEKQTGDKAGRIYAVIVAGGIGSRMASADKPKQFMMLGDRPIIIHTLGKFCRMEEFREIIVLCPADWVEYTERLVGEYLPGVAGVVAGGPTGSGCGDQTGEPVGSTLRITVIPGGDTRNETIMRAIDHIEQTDGLHDDTVIVTHDSVRPFVTERIIRENIEYALGGSGNGPVGACTTAVPATDTILIGDGEGYISEIPDRSRSYQCQTPQTFPAGKLRELYGSLADDEKEVLTDAARIFLMKGEKVHIVEGDIRNIKITYPHDMIVAEAMLSQT